MSQKRAFGQSLQTQQADLAVDLTTPDDQPMDSYVPPAPPPEVRQRKWVLPLLFVMFLIMAGVIAFAIRGFNNHNGGFGTAENCTHQWGDATCDAPQKCIKCGEDHGSPLGHLWTPATCQMPAVCERCGATSGDALAHVWVSADCEHARTCSQCGITDGAPNGHLWTVANCQMPRTCSVCGKSEGAAAGHDWIAATCEQPRTCSVCGLTEGTAPGHDWVFATVTSPDTCSVCGETRGSLITPSFFDSGYVQTKTGDVLNLRTEPSVTAKVVTGIPQHTNLSLYTSGRSNWYYVTYNNKSGYVSSDYIVLGYYDEDYEPFPGHTMFGYVKTKTGSSLNLRASTSTSSQSLALIPDGTTLELFSYENGWYYTYYDGIYGYVREDYIRT